MVLINFSKSLLDWLCVLALKKALCLAVKPYYLFIFSYLVLPGKFPVSSTKHPGLENWKDKKELLEGIDC